MDRRDFLKLGSLFSLSMLMPLNTLSRQLGMPVEAQAHGLSYRGTRDGDVYVSKDAGLTWQLHTRFGSGFSIVDLKAGAREQLLARIEYVGHDFGLSLAPNSHTWMTM